MHSGQPCGMVMDSREHSMRPDWIVQAEYEHRVHLIEMVLDGHDNVFVGHVGHIDDKGAGGGGVDGDGDRVGAVGLMCAQHDCNIDMRRNSFTRTRSIKTGRQGPKMSRTTTRTRSPSPWRRTRRATTPRLSLTLGGTRGTSSYLSNAASLLGARGVQDHHFHQGTGALQQTILVEKAKLGQSDGKRCRKEQDSVAELTNVRGQLSGAGSNEKVEKAG